MKTRSAAVRVATMASQAPDVLRHAAAVLKARTQRLLLLALRAQPSVYALPRQENKHAATSTQKIS
jgi:hypothetical protein